MSIRYVALALAVTATAVFLMSMPSAEAGTTVPTGAIETDTTWTVAGSPYNVTGIVTVRNGATLTWEPGVTVAIGPSGRIDIGDPTRSTSTARSARLAAAGTEGTSITVTGGPIRFLGEGGAARDSALRNVTLSASPGWAVEAHQWSLLTLDNVTVSSPLSGGLYLSQSSPLLQGSDLIGGPYGVYATDYTSSPVFRGNLFQNQTTRHARVGLMSVLDGNTFAGTGTAVELIGGNRYHTTSFTWHGESVTYELLDWFGLQQGAVLTVEPGVTVAAGPSAYVQVSHTYGGYSAAVRRGQVIAEGTPEAPIVFTSTSGSAANGWGGFRFTGDSGASSASVFRNVTFLHAGSYAATLESWDSLTFDNVTFVTPGSAGLYLSQSSPLVTGSTFRGGAWGMYATAYTSRPTILGSHFENQTSRHARVGLMSVLDGNAFAGTGTAVEFVAGNRYHAESFTLRAEPVAYELLDWFGMQQEAALTIEPGVHLRAGPSAYIQIANTYGGYSATYRRASLYANGTTEAPILIESTSGSPTNGWGGIRFSGDSGVAVPSSLRNVTLRNAASYALDVESWSPLLVDNVTFETPGSAGMYLSSASPTITTSRFQGGAWGIYATSYVSTPTVQGSTFTNQTSRFARLGIMSVLEDNVFTGTGTAVELVAGNRYHAASFTLRAEPVAYELLDWFGMQQNATLTIEPGVHIRAGPSAYIQIANTYGGYAASFRVARLYAEGTTEAPILIESTSGSATNGWGGIRFAGDSGVATESILRNVTLRNAQGNALALETWSPLLIDNVTFETPSSVGLHLSSSSPLVKSSRFLGGPWGLYATSFASAPTVQGSQFLNQTTRHARMGILTDLTGNTFAGTGTAVELLGGNRFHSGNVVLHAEAPGYDLHEWVGISGNGSLTLEPGVTLRLGQNSYLTIGDPNRATVAERRGRLLADATAEVPIVIESLSGSTTNGWQGLRFQGGSGAATDSVLRNVTLRNAQGAALALDSWSLLTLDNVTFDRATSYGATFTSSAPTLTTPWFNATGSAGLYLSSSSPTIRHGLFTGAQRGIEASSYVSRPTVLDTRFENQTVRFARVGFASLLQGNTFWGTGSAVELLGGNTWYHSDVTLPAAPGVYDLYNWVGFRDNATLTIEPGVTVRGASDAYIVLGDPNYDRNVGLRYRGGSYSLVNTSVRFAQGVAVPGCETPGPDLGGYVCEPIAFNWTDVSATGTAVSLSDDSMSGAVPIGFNFTFYNRTYSQAYISSNGFIAFSPGTSNGCCSGQILPNPAAPNNLVAGYWEDLYPPGGSVKYETVGTAPERVFIVQYTGVPHYSAGNHVTFQITLRESDNAAEVHLLNAPSDGGQHATGIEDAVLIPAHKGRLIAEGTEAAPIVLESLSGSTTNGWQGLRLEGAASSATDSVLRNVTLRNAIGNNLYLNQWSTGVFDNLTLGRSGSHSLSLSSSSPTFTSLRVTASGGHGIYVSGSSAPVFVGGVVEQAAAYGIYAESSALVNLQGTTVRNSTQRVARLRLDSTLVAPVFSGNAIQEIEYWGMELSSNATLQAFEDSVSGARIASVLTGDLTVRNGATWTIDPGSLVLVENARGVNVGSSGAANGGSLVAEGTLEDPIVFTSRTGATASGWYGLYLYGYQNSGATLLRNVTLSLSRDDGIHSEYHGTRATLDNVTLDRNARHGLYLYQSNPQATNLVITYPGSHGIYEVGGSHPTVRGGRIVNATGYGVFLENGNSANLHGISIENATQRPARLRLDSVLEAPVLSGNAIKEIEYWGFDVTSDQTLAPYYDALTGERHASVILTDFTVRNAATWTVAADTRVLVDNARSIIIGCCSGATGRGNLTVLGTAEQPVTFTSRTGSAASGWYGFAFHGYQNAGSSVLRNVTVSLSRDDGLYAEYYSGISLDNVTFDRNTRHGLYLYQSNPQATNLVVNGSGSHGIYEVAGSHPTIRGGRIANSSGYGILLENGNSANLYDLVIENVTQRPARLRLDSILERPVLMGNGIKEIEYWGFDVTSDQTLAPFYDALSGERYASVILTDFTVRNGATWTVLADARVLVENARSITLGCCSGATGRGNLSVLGTAEQPVTFTSRSGTSASGWYGFAFHGYQNNGVSLIRNATIALSRDDGAYLEYYSGLTFDNVTFDRNARHGVYIYQASPVFVNPCITHSGSHGFYGTQWSHPTIRGGIVENSTGYGVVMEGGSSSNIYDLAIANSTQRPARVRIESILEGPILSGNAIKEVEYTGYDLYESRTLAPFYDAITGERHASVILGDFTVRNDATWTVLADARVLVENARSITIGCCSSASGRGHLQVLGTAEQPVTFTSRTGSASTGWYGFAFHGYQNQGVSAIRNATIALSRDDGVYAEYYTTLALDNVTFERNNRYGLYAYFASPTVTGSRFVDNPTGMYAYQGSPALRDSVFTGTAGTGALYYRGNGVVVEGNTFTNASSTGLYLQDSDGVTLRGNRFTDNALGVRIDSASASGLAYNNLFRNLRNAEDASTSTRWNVTPTAPGLPLNVCGGPRFAGNCWHDYAGVDNDSDGLGDTLVPYRANLTGAGDQKPLVVMPNAAFVFETLNATLGLIQFTEQASSPMYEVVNWTWVFGDGEVSHDRNPLKDYDVEGLYNVTLTVVDAGGHSASATRTVLLDTLPPVTTGLLEGVRGDAGWWVSNVTVTLVSNDSASRVDGLFYRLDGIGSFLGYTGPLNLTREGLTTLEYFAVDIGGNAEPVRRLNVSIDRSRPLTNLSLAGTLHEVGWYTTNVTAALLGNDSVSGLNATFYRLDGSDVRLYTQPFAVNGTGVHVVDPFSKDVAGNLEAILRRDVRVDVTPPVSRVEVLAGTPGTNGWYRSAVEAGLNATDEGAGVAGMLIGVDGSPLAPYSGPVTLTGDGIHDLRHRAIDLVDHAEEVRNATLRIDATVPTLTVETRGTQHPTGWYTTAPVVYVNATDATSGVALREYRLNGATATYSGPVTLSTTRSHVFSGKATDVAGNVLSGANLTLRVDLEAPTTGYLVAENTHGSGTWYRSNLTVALTPSDGLGSGVLTTTYRLDGGLNSTYLPGQTLRIEGEGTHRLNASSTDVVGWVEAVRPLLFGIDLTSPLTGALVNGTQNPETGVYHSATTVRLLAEDPLSGVSYTQYWLNGVYQGATSGAITRTLTLSGVYNFTYRAVDLAGNVEPLRYLNLTLQLDITPPTTVAAVTGAAGSNGWLRGPARVSLTATDLEAGVGVIEYRFSSADDWALYTGAFNVSENGNHTLLYRATDLVGNVEGVKTRAFKIDTTPPEILTNLTGPLGLDGWYTGPVTLRLSQADAPSGIWGPNLKYRIDNGTQRTYTSPIVLNESGIHVLNVTTLDLAGNPATREVVVAVDVDLPVANLSAAGIEGNDSWFRSSVVVTLNGSDPTSGVLGLYYRVGVDGEWLPYVGSLTFDLEGRHRIQYYAIDGSGTPGLVYEHEILIDLTTPILGLHLENTLYTEIRGHIYVQGELCIEVTGLDLLSGVEDAWLRLTGVVRTLVRISLEVELHCFDLGDGDGPLGIGLGVCDLAGNCDEEFAEVYADGSAPSVQILRPFPGAINVQNASIPVFRALFANPDVRADLQGGGLEEFLPQKDVTLSTANDTLARTTLVAGTRVPVWVLAHDSGNPLDRVELLIDGVLVGTATEMQNVTYERIAWERDENTYELPEVVRENVTVPAYLFEVDTFLLTAGDHEFTAKAFDLPGRVGTIAQIVGFLGPAVGNATADAVDEAVADKELPPETPREVRDAAPPGTPPPFPPELRSRLDRAAEIARVFLNLADRLAVDNYLYLDETVIRHYGLYGLVDDAPVEAPPLVFSEIGGPPTPTPPGGEDE